MTIDHDRNRNFFAYIDYACFNCTGEFAFFLPAFSVAVLWTETWCPLTGQRAHTHQNSHRHQDMEHAPTHRQPSNKQAPGSLKPQETHNQLRNHRILWLSMPGINWSLGRAWYVCSANRVLCRHAFRADQKHLRDRSNEGKRRKTKEKVVWLIVPLPKRCKATKTRLKAPHHPW